MYTIPQLQEIIEASLSKLNFEKDPQELYAPLRYMVSIGGKRLRPLTCLLVYSLFKDELNERVLEPAMALEVFHAFTLIHDDIMDNASIRRGQPTVYKKWNSNIAILSGDAMNIAAYSLISRCEPSKLVNMIALFNDMAAKVCEGQQYDMNFEELPFITMDDYIGMIGLKTAILIASSAAMGAIMGGADDRATNLIYKFAYHIGIAFQIQDDYFDTFGDEQIFGKAIGGDILNNKKSWLLVDAFRSVTPDMQPEFQTLLAMDASAGEEKIRRFKTLYEKLGVGERSKRAIDGYYRQAMKILEESNLGEGARQALSEWASMVIKRVK